MNVKTTQIKNDKARTKQMNKTLLLTVSAFLISLGAIIFLGVWQTPDPDLVPVADGRSGYAVTRRTPDGGMELKIIVENRSSVVAQASITTVRFHGQPNEDVPTPTPIIRWGDPQTLWVKVPDTCWTPSTCDFEIELDSQHQVNESDENNNKVSGQLLG